MNASKETALDEVDQERIPVVGDAAEPKLAWTADWAQDGMGAPQVAANCARKVTEKQAAVSIAPKLNQVETEKTTTKKKRKVERDTLDEKGESKEHQSANNDDDGVPPGDEGISNINKTDVLCGRGGAINVHPGNKHFRELINVHRRTYLLALKHQKPIITRVIVSVIRNSNGRFLKKGKDGLWYEIGDNEAREKTSQALRQRAPEMRKILFQQPKMQEEAIPNQQHQQRHHDQMIQQQQEQVRQQQMQLQAQLRHQQLQQQQMAFIRVPVSPATLMLLNPMMVQHAALGYPMFNHPLLAINVTMAATPQTVDDPAPSESPQAPTCETQAIHSVHVMDAAELTGEGASASQPVANPTPSDSVPLPAPAKNDERLAQRSQMWNDVDFTRPN